MIRGQLDRTTLRLVKRSKHGLPAKYIAMTKREELERRMDEATRQFAATKDPKFRREVQGLALALADFNHLRVLDDAVARCRDEDMRTSEVRAALEYFSARLPSKWPVEQFQKGLNTENDEGRWQLMKASLNGIRLNANALEKQHGTSH